MARKRKRSKQEQFLGPGNKRLRTSISRPASRGPVKQALLSQYYLEVLTLREYLLSKLPASSKIRRKKIGAAKWRAQGDGVDEAELGDFCLAEYLDQTLVGVKEEDPVKDDRWKLWTYFSQRADNSESTVRSGDGDGDCSQSEIVDFTIWQLFKSSSRSGPRTQHLLCQGFRRDVNYNAINHDESPVTSIPGVVSAYPNHHVSMLKGSPWAQILALMGKEGQRMMINLILDCGIFVTVESGHGNYFQLSGMPLSDMQVLPESTSSLSQRNPFRNRRRSSNFNREEAQSFVETRSPARILFVRNRILYAKAALNTQGNVRYGFRHIHVLNRYRFDVRKHNMKAAQQKGYGKGEKEEMTSAQNNQSAIHIMMYIFPREFGLHNVFTSSVDPRETVQPLKDYALREEEIASRHHRSPYHNTGNNVKLPKRLRVEALELVRKLSVSHSRCSYDELLNYYCPASGPYPLSSRMATQQTQEKGSTAFHTQIDSCKPHRNLDPATLSASKELPSRKATLMDYATRTASVSAFCRSVLSTLIPNDFWGEGDIQYHNKGLFMKVVDRFITLRRFETVSLHDALQGMKMHGISWLRPENGENNRMSQSDLRKRLDLFHEFVYYAFDSLLIPLIRSHFFVTESNVHQHRLFFFRQDIWRSICEPQLISIKHTMLEEVNAKDAQNLFDSRTIGFSQLRLLPKETGVRPIMNLRRRTLKKGHKKMLGSSINSILAPVYNMYTYEKKTNPDRLGATIFSVGDLYNKLKHFRMDIANSNTHLFFVKVDVQSAFDTIPQAAVLSLMQSLPSESEYRISKHAEIKPGEGHRMDVNGQTRSRPIRKWISLATSPGDFQSFDQTLESNLAVGKKHTVFVDNIISQFRDRNELLDMLTQHVQHNMVKIGKKFYRQKRGIPQGSVLSSILCNYFYSDLEAQRLGFLYSRGNLLLRLVDDFLLITTDSRHAKEFLQVMHSGLPEYGVTVNPAKTLVNFEVFVNGMKIRRVVGSRDFPYCGTLIDTKTLNIKRDRGRMEHMAIVDTLTVEYSKTPGRTFQRKVLNAFKLQAHAMFLDTSFNSLRTVFSNIYDSFVETATKMWRYVKCLPVPKQPGALVVTRTIQNLVDVAFILVKSKGQNKKNQGYHCAVSQTQVEWLALTAFHFVLRSRQARYLDVLAWLDARIQALREKKDIARTHLMGFVSTRASGQDFKE